MSAAHSNLCWSFEFNKGDPDAEFASAAQVVTRKISFARKTGMPMETRGILASYDPAINGLSVNVSHQMPHQFQLHRRSCSGCRRSMCASSVRMSAAVSASRRILSGRGRGLRRQPDSVASGQVHSRPCREPHVRRPCARAYRRRPDGGRRRRTYHCDRGRRYPGPRRLLGYLVRARRKQ